MYLSVRRAAWVTLPRVVSRKQAGELLASRIYGKAKEEMDYSLVATAVFTPVSLLSPSISCRVRLEACVVLTLVPSRC